MCNLATEGVVQLPVDSKRPSKPSGAWACRAVRRKVLEYVALGHGNRVVQRKSPPLVGFNSLPVASLNCNRLSTNVHGSEAPITTVEEIVTSTGS